MPRKTTPSAARNVIDAFEAACRNLPELAPDRQLLLGCSAGGDSMTLLDLCARAARRRKWALAVAHLDHRQRPESGEEALFVATRAKALGVEVFIERLDDELAEASPLSEDVMRQARLSCYRRQARQWEADAVLLAHQADDRAETFLIRLLAGSGPTGLASIRPVETVGELTIVRPLLSARRGDMRVYLESREIEWREDPSNSDLTTKRGWVRTALLPAIHNHIGLDPTARIVRASELIEDEARVLSEATDLILAQLVTRPGAPIRERMDLDSELWTGAGDLLRRQLVRRWLWNLRRRPHPPGFAALGEAMAFIRQARPGATLRTIERIHIVHCKGSLLAFDPSVDEATRREVTQPYLPPPKPKKKKKKIGSGKN